MCRPYQALVGNLQGYLDFADVIYGVPTATLIISLHQLGQQGRQGQPSRMLDGAAAGGIQRSAKDTDRAPAYYQHPALNAVVSVVLCLIICYTSRGKMFGFHIAGIQLRKIAPGCDYPDTWILAFLLGLFVTQAARRISSMFIAMASSRSAPGQGARA